VKKAEKLTISYEEMQTCVELTIIEKPRHDLYK